MLLCNMSDMPVPDQNRTVAKSELNVSRCSSPGYLGTTVCPLQECSTSPAHVQSSHAEYHHLDFASIQLISWLCRLARCPETACWPTSTLSESETTLNRQAWCFMLHNATCWYMTCYLHRLWDRCWLLLLFIAICKPQRLSAGCLSHSVMCAAVGCDTDATKFHC